MMFCIQEIDWLFQAWCSSLFRTISFGSLAILLFWLIDRSCHRLHPSHRSWLWRALYVKLAFSLVCSATLLTLPAIPVFPKLVSQVSAPTQSTIRTINADEMMRSVPDVVLANVDSGVAATTFPPVTIYEPVIRLHGMKWQYAILLFWLLGTAVCVFCIASRYYGLIRRLRAASVPIDRQTVEIYRSIVVDLQIARPPRLQLVDMDCSPCLVWDQRSTIVLPADFSKRFGANATRIAMAHELGHFVRRDLLWNCLASAVTTWLFFFPLAWLMNRRYRIALEMACDAFTIDRAHVDRRSYANLLVGLLDARGRWPATTTVVAMAGSGSYRSLSTRLNAMKLQKNSHVWFRGLSLGAIGCVAVSSLLPLGFAQERDSSSKATSEIKSATTVAGQPIDAVGAASDTAPSSSSATVNVGGEGGLTFRSTSGSGASAGRGSSAGSSASASSGVSFVQGQPLDVSKRDESVSISTNSVDGKQSMAIEINTKSRTIRIQEDEDKGFQVVIVEQTGDDSVKNSYSSKSRKEFAASYPDVYAKIRPYFQNVTIGTTVASVNSANSAAPTSTWSTKPKTAKVKGVPTTSTIAGMPKIPTPPTSTAPIAGVAAVAGLPQLPKAPIAPVAPVAPKAPAIKGVLEALDKIQAESAGNAEIERLIESIKAKLEDGKE